MGKRPPLACMATAVFACCVPAYAQHLCSSDLHSGDGLGHALAVSGEFALVGAPESDAVGPSRGEAWLFQRVGGAWLERERLLPEPSQSTVRFGTEVAKNHELLAVLAMGETVRAIDGSPVSLPGRIWVYRRVGRSLERIGSVQAPSGALGFGTELCFLGDLLCVGARQDSSGLSHAGAVHLYRVGANGVDDLGSVQGASVDTHDHFGTSLAGDEGWLAVGAPADDDHALQSGAVYMFERIGDTLVERQKLIPSQAEDLNYAGAEVAVFGRWLAVGMPGNDLGGTNAGIVTMFENQGGVWSEVGVLIPPASTPGAAFGHSLAGHDDCLCIGAPLDGERGPSAGAIYSAVYSTAQGWSIGEKLLSPSTRAYDYLGIEVAVSDGYLFGSAPNSDACGVPGGTVACFPVAELQATWYEETCFCDGGRCPGDGTGGCANSMGSGAVLSVLGGPSILDGDLELRVTGLPSNRRAAILFGPPGPPSLVGSGILCFDGPSHRVAGHRADRKGVLETSDLMKQHRVLLHALPGTTWGFQAYFSDPGGPCLGRVNTSQAIWVTFEP